MGSQDWGIFRGYFILASVGQPFKKNELKTLYAAS